MAQNRLFNSLVSKMKLMVNRFANINNARMSYGAIYQFSYQNYHRDPNPIIFCMGQYQGANGKNYTHGFNTNYLADIDKQWLARTLYLINKSGNMVDPRSFYNMVKMQRPSIIKTSYRIYFSNMGRNPKLLSSGFTSMYSLVYRGAMPNWIASLNKMLQPSNTPNIVSPIPQKIALNTQELQERITMAKNAIPLNQARVTKNPFGGNGTAFGSSSPFGGR